MGHFDRLLANKVSSSNLEVLETGVLTHGGLVTSTESVVVAISATADANSDGTVVQPANTTIKSVYVIPQGTISSSGTSGDDLDISIGAATNFADIVAATALLDDAGGAVTMSKGMVLPIIKEFQGSAANDHAEQGCATSEAVSISAGKLTTTSSRDVNVRFTSIDNDLTATDSVRVVFEFIHFA
tara:strand:+ start:801 stop:1355 length:555 start_codon:yes stop_codon:yes gene_type:complete